MSPLPEQSDTETMQISAKGTFSGDENAFSLAYTEEDGTHVSLHYDAEGGLEFRRGVTNTTFVRGKTTVFSHWTGYGMLEIEAYTTRLDLMEKNGSYLLTLTYFSHISDMVQQNTMKWKLTR